MTFIVGICGPAGSGKTTAANHLVEKYGAKKYTFADPIKEFCRNAFDFSEEQLFGTQAQKNAIDPRYGKSPRWFFEHIGTEGGQKTFGKLFWVEMLWKKMREDKPELAVIDDVRFIHEAEHIRAFRVSVMAGEPVFSGKVLRLEPPANEIPAISAHPAEYEWRSCPYDYILAPPVRDVPALKSLVDDAARHLIIFPKRPELPL